MSDTPAGALVHLVQDTIKSGPTIGIPEEAIEELKVFSEKRMIPIWEREQKSMQDKFILSLVGLTNVGKSTLMEALLGFPVAPQLNGPATAIPVEYNYSETWSIKVQYRSAKYNSEDDNFTEIELLKQHLKNKVIDITPDKAAEIVWVTVCGPMTLLEDGLVMADTPGFGAARNGDYDESNQHQLNKFITDKVGRVYFCIAAGGEWVVGEDEKKAYEKIHPLCGHVVITKWEGSDGEKKDYRNKYQHLFFPGTKFVFINAKRAIKGEKHSSNLEELIKIINNFSTMKKRRAICDMELISAWKDINENMNKVHNLSRVPWRDDSLAQFIRICCERPELEEFATNLNNIYKQCRSMFS